MQNKLKKKFKKFNFRIENTVLKKWKQKESYFSKLL